MLDRCRPHGHAVDGFAAQVAPDEVEGCIERLAPGLPGRDGEGGPLRRIGKAEAEGDEETPARQAVEGGQLLGHHRRVAPGEHQHPGADLEPGGAGGGVGEAHDRIRRRAGGELGQPQRVEAQALHRRHGLVEPAGIGVAVDSHDEHYDLTADEILVGAGRAPNVEGLGLEAAPRRRW